MKIKSLLVLLSFFCASSMFAQDTIIKLSNERVIAKVMEITSTEVKYKRFDMPDGPSYVENKSNLKAIKYANGMVENFETPNVQPTPIEPIPSDEPIAKVELSSKISYSGGRYIYQNHLLDDEELNSMLMQTKDKRIMGLSSEALSAKSASNIWIGVFPFAIGATVAIPYWAVYAINYNNNWGDTNRSERDMRAALALLGIAGTIACPVAGGAFKSKRNRCNRRAVELYNEKY